MANPNDELRSLIESFAAQLELVARRATLERVLATLGGDVPWPGVLRGVRGRPKGSKNKVMSAAPAAGRPKLKPVRKGRRRTAADVEEMGAVLLSHVKANPGQRADQIAKALRTDPDTMRLPMQALLTAKKVKTQGQRRGVKYFVAGAALPARPAASKKKNKKKSKGKRTRKGRKQSR